MSGPSPSRHAPFTAALDTVRRENRYRVFQTLARDARQPPRARRGDPTDPSIVVWCSNDTLGLSAHPEVRAAATAALDQDGLGAGGTRNISGTSHHHAALESRLATLHATQRALLFTSAYVANDTTLATLGRIMPDAVILSDARNHASMIEGIRRSGLRRIIFPHNDTTALRAHLADLPRETPKIIACESLYSMDGDRAPLEQITEIADAFGALIFLDEVHAVGLYGPDGAGLAARAGVADRIDILNGTLGKAYGAQGGYIAGSDVVCDAIRSLAPGFIFTTAPAPPVIAGARAAIDIAARESALPDGLQARHRARVADLRRALEALGVPLMDTDTHILPIMVGDPGKCRWISEALLDAGHYVQPINYPTVPRGTERLRITPTPHHDGAMTESFLAALDSLWSRCALARAAA